MHGVFRPVLPNNLLFQLSWSQINQLICAFISQQLQLAGYLVEIIIPRYLEQVCKISRYLANILLFVRCVFFTSPKTRTMHVRWAKYLELISWAWVSSFEVDSRADEDGICTFGLISQIRNGGSFWQTLADEDRPFDYPVRVWSPEGSLLNIWIRFMGVNFWQLVRNIYCLLSAPHLTTRMG